MGMCLGRHVPILCYSGMELARVKDRFTQLSVVTVANSRSDNVGLGKSKIIIKMNLGGNVMIIKNKIMSIV